MHNVLANIIRQAILRNKKILPGEKREYSSFELARGFRDLKITVISGFKSMLWVSAGITSAAFGLKGFLLPSNFIDGGTTGISLLVSETTGVPLYILLILINIPFIFLGYRLIDKQFAIKTALAIMGLALCVATINFPLVTQDKLLVAAFGGFFLGAGIGLSVRGGAVIDGTEVLAIFLSRKLGTTIGDIIIIINLLIFSTAAYFLSVETALYAIITYLAASKTLDFIIEGIEEYTSVTIISSHSAEIREMIIEKMGRGVTLYKGQKGFGKTGETKDVNIVITVITRLEISRLNVELTKIDPHAFIYMSSVKNAKGGLVKKRPLKH
ncbi:MAG: YitT family protein [Chitinophagaceae bacterium]|nr:YitT family protein [Chitinophagaceae bacterium]